MTVGDLRVVHALPRAAVDGFRRRHTIYGLDDRYRGVFGMRRVVFIHRDDLAMPGLEAGDKVDIASVWSDGIERRADGFVLAEYDIPRGCVGACYPETNPLVPLDSVAVGAGTPTSKSIPVPLHPADQARGT